MALEHLALAISLVPEGKDMPCETHPDWLIEQWRDMMHWKSVGYVGLDRGKCMPQWAGIMKYADERQRRIQIVTFTDDGNDSIFAEATQMYANEAVQRLEVLKGTAEGNQPEIRIQGRSCVY
jgi:hypothetical protein